ncbi:hypothetical protein Patl1_18565 [Pistacia atlantica]|uniref:Uncharacterized protein n=1 Tax=Pistacia atlantica TaxID=434234 RepID=A0ACC1C1S4_9ROSI|nr:hypothetical protein Patl1_18565 [Pistacia atlantica]
MAAERITASCSSSLYHLNSQRRRVPLSSPACFLGRSLRPSHFLGSTSAPLSSKFFNSRHTNRRNFSVFAMAAIGEPWNLIIDHVWRHYNPMATLSIGIAPATTSTISTIRKIQRPSFSRLRISCIGWDPEGILGPAQTGHIARLEFKRRLEKDVEAREAFEQHVREETERRRALRQSRAIPDTSAELIEYFLDTEAQEIEYEIARLRPRFLIDSDLDTEFVGESRLVSQYCPSDHWKKAMAVATLLKKPFPVNAIKDIEDRLIELETLQKALQEGTEAYDKMQSDLITAKKSLSKILTSKDVKATLLEMVEHNEINRSLLTLLDENIANAQKGDQVSIVGNIFFYLLVKSVMF